MRFYLIDMTDLNGLRVRFWFGTQDDARAGNRELGRKPGDFEAVDVPDDKAGRLTWMNENARWPAPGRTPVNTVAPAAPRQPDLVEPAPQPAQVEQQPPAPPPADLGSTTAVVDHILASSGHQFGRYLRAAVRRLGELGDRGRRAVEGGFDMSRPGASFDRGAALLGTATLLAISARSTIDQDGDQ